MIEKIEFQKKFPPFKKGGKITFGDHKNQQSLIKNYLKNNSMDSSFAERIRIDIVVGNNGSGKSRLFESILAGDSNSVKIYPSSKITTILDDFFVGSKNINSSVNNEVLRNMTLGQGMNPFYCNLFSFLNDTVPLNEKKVHIKQLISNYLNLEKDIELSLVLRLDKDFAKNKLGGEYIPFMEEKSIEALTYDRNFVNRDKMSEIQDNMLLFLDFAFSKLNKENNLNYEKLNGSVSNEELKTLIFSIGDLILYSLNYFRGGRSDHNAGNINNDSYIFESDNYQKFRKILGYISDFILLISKDKESILGELKGRNYVDYLADDKKGYESTGFPYPGKVYKMWDILETNIDILIKILDLWENDKKEEAGNLSKIHFDLSLHWLGRKISGYEYSRTSGKEYFMLELIYSFKEKITKDDLENMIQTLQNIVYYKLMYSIDRNNLEKVNFNNIKNCVLTKEEKKILSLPFFDLDLEFSDTKKIVKFNNFSGGEKTKLVRFINIFEEIIEKVFPKNGRVKSNTKESIVILIDEPDLHLHLDRQRQYIQDLIDFFYNTTHIFVKDNGPFDKKFHFIIATHSPFIISDVPKENIILLKNGEQIKNEAQIFGANYVDLIRNGFFFDKKSLMGSFAENIIGNIADEERKKIMEGNFKENELKKIIGDDFLRDNLFYFKSKK